MCGRHSEFRTLFQPFFQSPEVPAFPLLRCAGAARTPRRCRQPLHAAQLDLLGSRRWGVIRVEISGARLGHVRGLELEHLDDASVAASRLDDNAVTGTDGPMRLSMVAVDLHPSTTTGGLRLCPGLEETRHVEPDIEPHGVIGCHSDECRGPARYGQARAQPVPPALGTPRWVADGGATPRPQGAGNSKLKTKNSKLFSGRPAFRIPNSEFVRAAPPLRGRR